MTTGPAFEKFFYQAIKHHVLTHGAGEISPRRSFLLTEIQPNRGVKEFT